MKYSLIPCNYKKNDPRNLLYHFPSIPIVKFAKLLQDFYFYKQLELAEDLANRNGFILLPFSCMHWERAKKFAEDRRVKIGRHSFFMMKQSELTKNEESKLKKHLEEVRRKEKKRKIS